MNDTLRLERLAGIALAIEGRAPGFGSELAASRELDVLHADFRKALDAGMQPGDAMRAAIDGLLPTNAL